jgi:signal transduction histidine kinase
LTLLATAAVVAINIAGIWEITTARRAMRESARRVLLLETEARAREIESRLSQTRSELAFMAGSPVFYDLEAALEARDPTLARWRRLEAEGALLLFMRGHPEVMRAVVRSPGGQPLLEAARRGGVPVLWMSLGETPTGPGRRAADPIDRPVEGRFEPRVGTRTVEKAVAMEITIDAARVLAPLRGPEETKAGRICQLSDGEGKALASDPGARSQQAIASPAEASVSADGWSAPAPWTLACREAGASPFLLLEPLAARYRTTLLLNLGVMCLALLLGAFAIHQTRGRQALEASAREEARVRELERQLFHAERLGTVGRLAAGMAHEINNPLEGMSNYLSLARADLERGDAPSARRRLDGVHEGLQRMAGVVSQVLAHSDPAKAPMAPVDLAAALRQAVEFVGSRPEFQRIRFSLDLDPALPAVMGRQALLGQVFLNMMLNACEAQPEGGEVRIAGRREGTDALIEIADRGPGVPAAQAARIFEPFYSTKQSTGLGLSICYAIVTQHHGDLRVLDRPGGGALFRISLPVGAPAARQGGAVA